MELVKQQDLAKLYENDQVRQAGFGHWSGHRELLTPLHS